MDLEPQGKIRVVVELKWHGMYYIWSWHQTIWSKNKTPCFSMIRAHNHIHTYTLIRNQRSKQFAKRKQCTNKNGVSRRVQRASRLQSAPRCYAKTCPSGMLYVQLCINFPIKWMPSIKCLRVHIFLKISIGEWTQIHGDVSAAADVLLTLPRIHLVNFAFDSFLSFGGTLYNCNNLA